MRSLKSQSKVMVKVVQPVRKGRLWSMAVWGTQAQASHKQPLLINDSPPLSPPPITSAPSDHTRAHSALVICSFFSTSTAPRVCLPRLALDEGANPSLFYRPQCTKEDKTQNRGLNRAERWHEKRSQGAVMGEGRKAKAS